MRAPIISADGHIDLPCLPETLFVDYAPAHLRERVPHVVERDGARVWTAANQPYLGHVGGVGPHGAPRSRHTSPRIERMAAEGLYDDQERGILRTTTPELRAKDGDRDGIAREVIYGILLVAESLDDPEAATVVVRAYNEFLSDFCRKLPGRFAGIGCLAGSPEEAAAEVRRCAELGLKGAELSLQWGMVPLWNDQWEPIWQAGAETGIPIHLHSIGSKYDDAKRPRERHHFRRFAATKTTAFQIGMLEVLAEVMWSGALARYPTLRVILGESGIGWIPYALERMDTEYEQFRDAGGLEMLPSEYWRRQMAATFQDDQTGIDNVERLGAETLMWGADYPHPDGTWPDSLEFIERQLGGLPESIQRKILYDNAARIYGFPPADETTPAA